MTHAVHTEYWTSTEDQLRIRKILNLYVMPQLPQAGTGPQVELAVGCRYQHRPLDVVALPIQFG